MFVVLETKRQDISASAASIFTILFFKSISYKSSNVTAVHTKSQECPFNMQPANYNPNLHHHLKWTYVFSVHSVQPLPQIV